jgi:hypothetical protein
MHQICCKSDRVISTEKNADHSELIIKCTVSGVENGNALEPSGASYRDQIVQAAGDALAEDLDEQHGDQVTDHEVFRCAPYFPPALLKHIPASDQNTAFIVISDNKGFLLVYHHPAWN